MDYPPKIIATVRTIPLVPDQKFEDSPKNKSRTAKIFPSPIQLHPTAMISISPEIRVPFFPRVIFPPRPLQRQVEAIINIQLFVLGPRHIRRFLHLVPSFRFPTQTQSGSGALSSR